MTAPTEAEIREVVEPAFRDNGTLNAAGRLSDAFSEALNVLRDLYDVENLRPSEEEALKEAAYDAIEPIQQQAIVDSQEALIAAGVRFAQEHPDVPRGTWSARDPVPA